MSEPVRPATGGSRRGPVPPLAWAALGVLAFSMTFPATSLAERSLPPLFVGAGRSIPSALLAAACLRRLSGRLPPRAQWPGLIAVALGCGIGFGVLSALALGHTSSSHGAVVVGLLPAATAVVAVIRVGDRPSPVFWLASAAGTAIVTAYALSRGAGTLHPADLLLLASVLVAAIGYAEGGRLARAIPGWQVVGWGLVLALPIAAPLTVLGAAGGHFRALSAGAVIGFAYVSTVSTFFGFFAWYRGLAEAGVAHASQVQLAQPLLTIAWSVPLLGERVNGQTVVTAVLVGICVLLTQRSRPAGRVEPPDGDRCAGPVGETHDRDPSRTPLVAAEPPGWPSDRSAPESGWTDTTAG